MHIAIVTAGGAGMFCGSCMHDNTWARALRAEGAEITLIPTYTPIRVDEEDVSTSPVYFGGINIYLDYRIPAWQKLPRAVTRYLDAPWLLNLVSRFGIENDASQLGELTLAILRGEAGPARRELDELVTFISQDLQPDVVCFSNALLGATAVPLRRKFKGQLLCLLQGDDVFLEALDERHRTQAIELIRQHASAFDGFLVHSDYYRNFMSRYLGLPSDKFHQIPLGIDVSSHDGRPRPDTGDPFTVGYFARICPEKGLHVLVDAFEMLHRQHSNTRLRVSGYLGHRDRRYFRDISRKTRKFASAFEYVDSPDHTSKVDFFKSLDVLSVPTVYREPKGIYVLEAMANGTPVVQPRHGAFPEIIAATGGGELVSPDDPQELAEMLEHLMHATERRQELANNGHANVRFRYDMPTMARETLALFDNIARLKGASPEADETQHARAKR